MIIWLQFQVTGERAYYYVKQKPTYGLGGGA